MFITFEGIDGSGKTTAIRKLKNSLETKGYQVLFTREPGGLEIAEEIRGIILKNKMDPMTEALLFLAARREHLVKVIIPALEQGKIVISDRFMDSTTVYQGYARGLDLKLLDQIQKSVIGEKYIPNLTIFFKVDKEKAHQRLANRQLKNRIDLESVSFKQKVADGYQKLAQENPQRFKVVDALLDVDAVQKIIEETVLESIAKNE